MDGPLLPFEHWTVVKMVQLVFDLLSEFSWWKPALHQASVWSDLVCGPAVRPRPRRSLSPSKPCRACAVSELCLWCWRL